MDPVRSGQTDGPCLSGLVQGGLAYTVCLGWKKRRVGTRTIVAGAGSSTSSRNGCFPFQDEFFDAEADPFHDAVQEMVVRVWMDPLYLSEVDRPTLSI